MKIFIILTAALLIPAIGHSGWIEEVIRTEAEDKLEPVVSDVGTAISGGMYQKAGTLGFPGIQVSVGGSGIPVSSDNEFIDQDFVAIPWVTAKTGLPMGFDVFARGFQYKIAGADTSIGILGAGVKYSIHEESVLNPFPGVSALIAHNRLSVSDFNVNTTSLGLLAGKDLVIITPYAGVFYDIIRSEIDTDTPVGTLKPSKNLMRFGGGVEFSPLPFLVLNASFNIIEGDIAYEADAGVRFTLPF